MSKKFDPALFDQRVVLRNLEKGLIKQKEYDAYLAKLQDLEEQASPLSLDQDEEFRRKEAERTEREKRRQSESPTPAKQAGAAKAAEAEE